MKKQYFLIFIFFISCSTAPTSKIKHYPNPLNIPLFNEFSTYFENEFAKEYLKNSEVFKSNNEIEIQYRSDRDCIISLKNHGSFYGSAGERIDGSLSNSLLLKKNEF